MKVNPVFGRTIRWTFSDGPMANKSFEHTFEEDGSVTWRVVDGTHRGNPSHADKCEIATVGEDVFAVSYLSDSGYTLTVVLDFRTERLTAFASNEKELTYLKGTFYVVGSDSTESKAERSTSHKAHRHVASR